jgi:hypothetical protein
MGRERRWGGQQKWAVRNRVVTPHAHLTAVSGEYCIEYSSLLRHRDLRSVRVHWENRTLKNVADSSILRQGLQWGLQTVRNHSKGGSVR